MKPCKICGKKDGKCKTCSASNKALVDVIKLLSKKKKKGKKKVKGASLAEYAKNKMLLDLQSKLTGSGGGDYKGFKTANLDNETIKKEIHELKEAQKLVNQVKSAAPLALSYAPDSPHIDYRSLPWTSPPPQKAKAQVELIDNELQRLDERRNFLVKHMNEAGQDRNPIVQKRNQEQIVILDKEVKQLNIQRTGYHTRQKEAERRRADAKLEEALFDRQRLEQEEEKHHEQKEHKKQLKKEFEAIHAQPRDQRHVRFTSGLSRLNEEAVLKAKQMLGDNEAAASSSHSARDLLAPVAAAAAAAPMISPVAQAPLEAPRSATASRGRPKSQRTLFEEAVAEHNRVHAADVAEKI